MKKTKIICTLGPSSESIESLKSMIEAGMNIARLNMAHGELEDHKGRIEAVRQAAAELNTFIPLMLDIKGPEIRIGKFREPQIELVAGDELVLTTELLEGDASRISVTYADLPQVLKPGSVVLIDDGLIELNVIAVEGSEIRCRIVNGGRLKPRKGVNLPGVRTTLPGVTERDVAHILFGLDNGIEMIAVSFVRKAADIAEVRRLLKEHGAEHVQIISKIENEEGLLNLDEIIEASDSIMIARGDLGVEIPVEEVPLVQKQMIDKCNVAGKPVIVATHMLESMQTNPRPTRAEANDVSTAVLQGADVVMLSGETAAGKYPTESVRTMATIAERAEAAIDYGKQFSEKKEGQKSSLTEVVSQAVVSSSLELDAKAIVAVTESGHTAALVAKYRPQAPIIGLTRQPTALPKLCLLWGVLPVLDDSRATTDELLESYIAASRQSGLMKQDDYVVIAEGVPFYDPKAARGIRIQQL